jgi:hypothetical protein
MSRIGRGYLAGISFAMVRASHSEARMEQPALSLFSDVSAGTGTLRRGTYAEVEAKARIPRMGAPSSKAVLALMTIYTPVPRDSINCDVVISQE